MTRISKALAFIFSFGAALWLVTPGVLAQSPPALEAQLSNGYAQLSITGPVGTICQLQYATNLVSPWLPLTNLTLASSPQLWVDTSSPVADQRFYRAMMVTNSAPVLTVPDSQTIDELALWTANATAIDTDLPPNILTFALVSGPTGLSVSSNGLISWTPTEAQGPSTNTVTVLVYDDGVPSLSATNSFTLTVNEVNSAPTLTLPANQTINELVPWTANATASDTDLPPNILTFALVSGPTGLTVSSTGLISWTPTEAQGPSTNTVTVLVFDDGVPSLSATNSFTLTVNEVNSAPTLTLPPDQTINELALWTANATASDTDLPPNILTFALVSGPTGLTVSSNGLISWTPTEAQGPSTNTVTVLVSDDGVPSLSATNSFTLTVSEVNSAPTLALPPNQTINELALWTANATAIDTDLPPNILTFALVSGPTGLTVSSNGLISWTPTEAQGPSTNTVTVLVSDDGVPSLSATNSFTLTVSEVNSAPTLALPPNQTINELALWTANATAIDTDLPPNILTFALVSGPTGLTVSSNGLISWTPTEAQGPSTNTVTVRVFDNGVPSLSATNNFTLTVNEVNSAPTLTLPPNQTIDELALWTANATAIDTDLPPNILTFALVSGPTGLTVSSAGLISWTPTGAQGPSTNTVTVRVFDNGVPSLSATNSFTIVVNAGSLSNRLFFENFDGVTAPALPSGWTTSATGAQTAWVGRTSTNDTAPNAAYVPDPSNVGTSDLVSPSIALPAGLSRLTFRNNYNLEADSISYYDGGVLEIKIGAGSFTDILAAGGSFVSGGYNGTISTSFSSPIAGRQAWSSNSAGFITTLVSLPATAAGQTVQFRWRCATDNGNGNNITNGWYIDTVSITNCACSCCWNTAPVLPAQANRAIAALTAMVVTNTATDPESPPQTLTYALLNSPTGSTIDASGIIRWTPSQMQNLSTNLFKTKVTDSGSPALSATNSFTVTVGVTNSVPTNMSLIPAGSFTMGDSTDGDVVLGTPVHTVYVSAFYMDQYLVTLALWNQVKSWNGGNGYSFENPGAGKAATHPVVKVNWLDAVKWCNARSEMEGLTPVYYTTAAYTTVLRTGAATNTTPYWKPGANGYRLPTEAEWEKAARGGASGHRFPWTDAETISHSRANYYADSNKDENGVVFNWDLSYPEGYHPTFDVGGQPYTSPVGYFAPNGYGLYDMAGNAWSWCWDWLGYYTGGSQTDPQGPSSGNNERVNRGGSWDEHVIYSRSAARGSNTPDFSTYYSVGFRSARSLGQ